MEAETLITHTKIQGIGVKSLLKQAEIDGIYDTERGEMKIAIDKGSCLVVKGEGNMLHFYLEAKEAPQTYPIHL